MMEVGVLVDNKYKILGEIGHGGMSTVYMAINEKANKTWAIKEVRKNGVVDFAAVKQGLVTETNLLKKLRHEHLPTIVDVIEDEERFLIVMDYIEGNSLGKIVEEHGAIPQKYVIAWAKQLCDTLVYLHTRVPPIIYRDMKPGNVMLKPDGNVMLIDFGTAREFKEKKHGDTMCLGTVGYAAPEQFGGAVQTDARTDIYGLGATMYHLLTGCNPGRPPYEIKPVCEVNPSLSAGLEHIIGKCTQRNPNDRYQSAAELMYALEHYEEMDGTYKRKQKKKCACFAAVAMLVLIFAVGGGLCSYLSVRIAANLYENLLDEAAKTVNYEEKLQLYEKCIAIPDKAGELEAYLGFIQAYKENDMIFTLKEANQITTYIKQNKRALQENGDKYLEICFQLGKMYWYYFMDEDAVENHAVRAKYALEWFEDVLRYAPEGYEHLGMAQVYAQIGRFYRDITMHVVEANDKGEYRVLYENLKQLMESVALDSGENEIVRLELLEFARNAIWQYAEKFKKDGIEKAELLEMLEQILEAVGTIDISTDVTKEKRENIILFLEEAQMAVNLAFAEGGF